MKHLGLDSSWLSLSPQQIILRIIDLNQQGQEVLYIAENESSYPNAYAETGIPFITIKQISQMKQTTELSRRMDQSVTRHARLTKRWNVIGGIVGAAGLVSAPLINLASDALSLAFLTRSKRISRLPEPHRLEPSDPHQLYQQQVAASSEAMSSEALWHTLHLEDILAYFQVSKEDGLTSNQVHVSRQRFGWNQLEGKKPSSFLMAYLMQFKEFTTLILLGSSLLALLSGDIFDGMRDGKHIAGQFSHWNDPRKKSRKSSGRSQSISAYAVQGDSQRGDH